MISENELVRKSLGVEIDRKTDQNVYIIFPQLEGLSINLSDSNSEDIKSLYNTIFEYIITNGINIEFYLDDNKGDLFHEVVDDIIKQMNSELDKSEEKLGEIIKMISEE